MASNKPRDPNLNAPLNDASANAAADVEAVMKKFDRESNTRVWTGVPKLIVGSVLVMFSLFCLYVTLFANFKEQVRLSSFLGLVILMGFLTFPVKKGYLKENHMPWYDIVLMLLGAGAFFYFTFNASSILAMRPKVLLQPKYTVIAVVGILVLAELCRRSVGLPVLCVAVFFLAYTFLISKQSLALAARELFFNTTGVLGTPINACSKFIVVFTIFGAFLERTGVSEFFINLANSITGRFAGGPAKVAVISSALCGMVSGSSVGNTVTTGSVTIPMMKETGYKPEFAGAVEAAASTGGQIMPPIMGAAAFLMSEILQIPYSNIIIRAILPAVLYFLGIFIAVHLEAKKLGLKGIDKSLLPRMRNLVKQTYMLLPLIILIYLVSTNARTMQFSAAIAIIVTIIVGIINNVVDYFSKCKQGNEKATAGEAAKAAVGMKGGFGIKSIFDSLESGGRSCITVAVACGMAGIITGCLTITGLASQMINGIVSLTQSPALAGVPGLALLLGLLLTMLCCIVLGMGIPTTATYCIMAATCAPILTKMGVPVLAAHFFVFYYGIVADITPPVALAAYAGAAIAKGRPMQTGVTATRLAIGAFIIPFVFAASPALLFIDTVWYEVILIAITATLGMFGVAAGLSGYLMTNMNALERILLIGGGLALIIPGTLTDFIGLGVIALGVLMQFLRSKKKAAA